MIAEEVFLSQNDPKVIVPMQMGETLRPLRPMYRYLMIFILFKSVNVPLIFGSNEKRTMPSLQTNRRDHVEWIYMTFEGAAVTLASYIVLSGIFLSLTKLRRR